jgi:hypothetical protein
MTLIVWKSPVVTKADEARALVDASLEEADESVLERSEDVVSAGAGGRNRRQLAPAFEPDNDYSSMIVVFCDPLRRL